VGLLYCKQNVPVKEFHKSVNICWNVDKCFVSCLHDSQCTVHY